MQQEGEPEGFLPSSISQLCPGGLVLLAVGSVLSHLSRVRQ